MPEPLVNTKFKSWDELIFEAQKVEKQLKGQAKIELLRKSMDKIFTAAKKNLEKNDLEMAYIYFYRCFILWEHIRKLEEFKRDSKFYENIFASTLVETVNQLEKLNPILKEAYERHMTPESNEKELEAHINNKISSPKASINGVKEESVQNDSEFISSIDLHHMLTTRKEGKNTTLIIDVRTESDFMDSQMKIDDVVNIPVDNLDCVTPHAIETKYLEGDSKKFFKKRKEYDWVIIVDWFPIENVNNPNTAVVKMMTALMRWDVSGKYIRKPRILEGGFDDWLSRYPTWTTNPNVSPPKMDNGFLQSTIENISFPDTFNFNPTSLNVVNNSLDQEKNAPLRPSFDRSTKPSFQDKNTEMVNSVNDGARIFQKEMNSEVSKLKVRNVNFKNAPTTYKSSDSDDETRSNSDDETQKEYSQRGRRSALANASDRIIYGSTELNNNADIDENRKNNDGKYRDEDEDEDSEPETKINENISGMKRASSTPNILKLSINEASRPPIDRSTKPSSNDDQLNSFTIRDNYYYNEMGKGLTGLKNLGNTCYMNSIIQCLSNTEQLRRHLLLLDPRRTNSQSKTRGHVARAFRNILAQLWSGESGSVSCKELKTIISEHRDTFRGYEQQDSHEFLTILIDWLHEDLKQPPGSIKLDGADESSGEKAWGEFTSKNNSIIRNLFYGQLKSTVCCSVCSEESVTFEPFSNLSLPLPAEEQCSLTDCLKLYISNENILGWQCPSCKTARNATKKLDITKLPPLLVIHLKRFTSDGWCRKRLTYVKFPSELNMSDFIIGEEHRFWRYRLYAISNHYGTMESGHYTAYCLNAANKSWYKFDDQEVSSLSGGVPKSSAAYIVFYQFIPN